MVKHAIAKGFDSIGFSGHSPMFYAPTHAILPENIDAYKNDVKRVKAKYSGEIGVYLGLEFDMYSQIDLTGYDYIIGSVHYFKIDDEYVGFDRSAEVVKLVIENYFGGSGIDFAKEYYKTVARLPEYADIDILGHFDLITKNCDKTHLFDTESREYVNAAVEALEQLQGKIPYFEVNTGAISRGYRKTPYPSSTLLREMRRLGFGALISSDCHDGRTLDCAFEDARELLALCGFKERYILTDSGFTAVEL